MSFLNALFRGMGIGLSLAIFTWLVTLSTVFIVEDANHRTAHLGTPKAGVPWPGFIIVLSCVEFAASVWISLVAAGSES